MIQKTQRTRMRKEKEAVEEKLTQYYTKERLEAISQLLATLNEDQKNDILQQFERSEVFKNMSRLTFLRIIYRTEGLKDIVVRHHYHQFISESFLPTQYLTFKNWCQFKKQNKETAD